MGDPKVGLVTKGKVVLNRVTNKLRAGFLNDTPPGLRIDRGEKPPTIQLLEQFNLTTRFGSMLPYESYDEEKGLYFNRDTVGFVLYALPATGLDVGRLKTLNGFFTATHKADTKIQITLYADPNIDNMLETWRSHTNLPEGHQFKEIIDMLSSNRVEYLKLAKWNSLFVDEPALLRNFHLVVSYTIPVEDGQTPYDLDQQDIDFLIRQREAFIGTLRSSSIFAQNMQPELFVNLLDGYLNPAQDAKSGLFYDDENLINKQMVDDDTMVNWDSGVSTITHKDEHYSFMPFHIRQFPQMWAGYQNGDLIGSFTNSILRFSCPFMMTLTVNVPDQVSEKGKVKTRSMNATRMAGTAIAKYVTQLHDRKKDWDYAAQRVDGGDKMVDAFFQVNLLAPQGKEQEIEQSLRGVYESLGWIVSRSRYIPIHAFLAALPMGVCKDTHKALKTFGHYNKRLSWTVTNIAPWVAEYKGTKTPFMLLFGRRGQLSFWDNFDNNQGNYNISCCAGSGGGKSFFTQELVVRVLGQGGRLFVIDAGHSYRNICELMGGEYIDFGVGRPCLNPFTKIFSQENLTKVEQLARENPGQYSMDDYILDMMPMLKILVGVMASPDQELSPKHLAALEIAITRAVKEHQGKTTITKVAEACLKQKDSTDSILTEAKDISLMLHSYTKEGMFGRYFEGDNNIDLDNPFVVLEIDALNSKGSLQGVVLLILMMQINQVMYLSGNKKQKKFCIIDEAWRLLGSGRAGSFIEEGYRVARKHGGAFMTITQKISDYYSSETAQAAFMNSDLSVYLRQKPEALAQALEEGHIDNSSGQVDILRGLKTEHGKFSELAINSPNGMSVHRFYVDPIAIKLYSTTADDIDFIQQKKKEGVGVLEAVKMLASGAR